MKAAWYSKNGEAKDVLSVGEQPTPKPAPGEVLVRLQTSGVNPSDVKSRRGRPLTMGPLVIPHSDGAGVIEAVGEGVPASRIGQRVWTWNGQWLRPHGTAAEYIALPTAQAVQLPDAVDAVTAANFGIPALTAIHAVRLAEAGGARSMLVTGAASAVGHYVTQIAARKGLQVIGTASKVRADVAREAGAAHVIDYKSEDVAARTVELTGGKGVDAIIDMDLSSTAPLLGKGVLAPHGTLVCYGSNAMGDVPVPFRDLLFRGLSLRFFVVYELQAADRYAAIAELGVLLQQTALKTKIAARYALEQIVAAHEAVEQGAFGNVVLEIG
ncbi:NADPH:quinone reductase [Ferrovibrio sp.]|uniref:NADPH:quinone reductase n=1 Tax=Ferrovibrio sp. TaxID=1917215 RepID=UPI000CC0D493|nr:NADPH:quinone reductase [Ferrovibrio sp.]PJI43903.1 MAG: NADPH:quinone oxidoreductase [Ferrovibrio sp.]